jgi:dTDP-4-dehydrorhamnose reductase
MKIIITGSGGRLGAALLRELGNRFEVIGFNHAQLDLSDPDKVRETLSQCDFDVLVNAAAFTNVDLAEKERDQAFRVNAEAPRVLAEICRNQKAKLVHFSTDYVFSGEKEASYLEEDETRPISAYGESKLAGEKAVLSVNPDHLVIRVSWVFGPDRPSFIDQMIVRARESESVAAVADKWSAPTYTRDIAAMLLPVVAGGADPGLPQKAGVNGPSRLPALSSLQLGDTGISGYNGILHFANTGQCSWQEYAQHALDCCREKGVPLKATKVDAVKMSDMKSWVARRPVHTVLAIQKYEKLTGLKPRSWRDAVAEYVRDFVAR